MDSFNASYGGNYTGKTHDGDMKIIDNTQIYIDLLDLLS